MVDSTTTKNLSFQKILEIAIIKCSTNLIIKLDFILWFTDHFFFKKKTFSNEIIKCESDDTDIKVLLITVWFYSGNLYVTVLH